MQGIVSEEGDETGEAKGGSKCKANEIIRPAAVAKVRLEQEVPIKNQRHGSLTAEKGQEDRLAFRRQGFVFGYVCILGGARNRT